MTDEDYSKALRLGEKAYKNAVSRGEYPYLPALDEFVKQIDVQSQVQMGLMDIPIDQIAGTKTVGRRSAFACNFMPLMKEGTEFAQKWISLFHYQLEEGINVDNSA